MADLVGSLACRDVVEFVTERFEAALPPDRAAGWDEHVAQCDGCAGYVAQFRTTIRAVRAIPSEPDVAARDRVAGVWPQARRGLP
jgi:anti-sigma factor RsiW